MSIIIGFSGIPGAGKTALVKALSKKLTMLSLYWDDFDDVSMSPDDYFDWHNQGKDYTAFNYSELANALKTLKMGGVFEHLI